MELHCESWIVHSRITTILCELHCASWIFYSRTIPYRRPQFLAFGKKSDCRPPFSNPFADQKTASLVRFRITRCGSNNYHDSLQARLIEGIGHWRPLWRTFFLGGGGGGGGWALIRGWGLINFFYLPESDWPSVGPILSQIGQIASVVIAKSDETKLVARFSASVLKCRAFGVRVLYVCTWYWFWLFADSLFVVHPSSSRHW